ncbi:MAG: hypothetical protein FWC41_02475 [Firmicutes bacterium]|nr:hypothetical protein [Bacillota bacterium]
MKNIQKLKKKLLVSVSVVMMLPSILGFDKISADNMSYRKKREVICNQNSKSKYSLKHPFVLGMSALVSPACVYGLYKVGFISFLLNLAGVGAEKEKVKANASQNLASKDGNVIVSNLSGASQNLEGQENVAANDSSINKEHEVPEDNTVVVEYLNLLEHLNISYSNPIYVTKCKFGEILNRCRSMRTSYLKTDRKPIHLETVSFATLVNDLAYVKITSDRLNKIFELSKRLQINDLVQNISEQSHLIKKEISEIYDKLEDLLHTTIGNSSLSTSRYSFIYWKNVNICAFNHLIDTLEKMIEGINDPQRYHEKLANEHKFKELLDTARAARAIHYGVQ